MANSSSFDHEQLIAECQRYLTCFRVLELKELLRINGQSTKGRKPELFKRANDLLQFGSPKFLAKIQEIYERSNCTRKQYNYNRTAQRGSPAKSSTVIKNSSRSHIVHPDVKFKSHPFFSKLDTIIRPTALVSSGMSTHGSLSMKLKFHLTPQQIHQIYVSKTSTGTYETQVLVRFCLQETTCDQNDHYPKQCYVKVNGHNGTIPGYHPHLSTRPDYKRNGQPVNITNFVKTSPAEINEVVIYWAHDIMIPQGYCVGIEIAEVVSSSDLLQALKAKGLRSPDMSRALVREKFAVDKDSEVAATSMKVSLLCPIGKMRMTYPCRTTQCNHLQCFDASIFYQMNEKRARWVCPVCDKAALPGDLFIDGLFMEICQKSLSSNNIIEFSVDGSWQPASDSNSTSLSVCTPDRRGNSPIALDTPETKKSDVVVIDLTASSDEEDEGDGGQKTGEEEEEEEEEGEIVRDRHNVCQVPRATERRPSSDEATLSDSESTISSHSSSTIAAPNSPQPHGSTFPHLSIPLSSSHHTPSSRPHSVTLSSSETPARHSPQPTEFSVIIPTSSISLSRLPTDSQTTPTASSNSLSSLSSSRPMSVIMQTRPHSDSHVHPHPHSHSYAHLHPQFHSHSRVRKHSRSSSHSHSHKHAQSSSRLYSRTSSRGEGASVPSRGVGRSVPYPPLQNGYPPSGDALLTSNILSLDENIFNLFRTGYIQFPMSSSQSHAETND